MTCRRTITVILLTGVVCGTAYGQTSSIGAKRRKAMKENPPPTPSREAPKRERNAVYEKYSWISSTPPPPRTFKPGDLITLIVRERRQWEADADLETKRKFDAKSELDAFTKLTQGGIGASAFRRGKPNIDYKFDTKLKSEGDSSRQDRLTTRLTGSIIDVKPNGLLVIEAVARVQHDEEISKITLTGMCRKEDVTADNTILSTQVADKNVVIDNEGALRATARRGWITRLLDLLRPI